MDDDTKAIIAGLVRHGMTAGAGVLATHGVIVGDSDVQVIAAGVIALIGVVWSAMHKKGKAV